MASYNVVAESEQLLNTTPKTKSWKRLAGGMAAASFVIGLLAVTAVKSSVGLRGATSLKHHKTGTMQIKLISDPSKCLAVRDHNEVGPESWLEIYDCKSNWETHDQGQAFTYEINDEGNVGTIKYGEYCVSVADYDAFDFSPTPAPYEGNYFILDYCSYPGDPRQNLVWDIADGVTGYGMKTIYLPGVLGSDGISMCMDVSSGDTSNRIPIQAWTCNAQDALQNQQWSIVNAPPSPPGPQTSPPNCGIPCSTNSDCGIGGFLQYSKCYVYKGTRCYGYCGPAPPPPPPPSTCDMNPRYCPGGQDSECAWRGGNGNNPCKKCDTTRGSRFMCVEA